MKNLKVITLAALVPLIIMCIYSCADTNSLVKWHPVEIKTLQEAVCSRCHTNEWAAFDHGVDFVGKHKFYAQQRRQSCEVCHTSSFCSDCHANKPGIIPSDRYKDSPEISYPHRGDYLTQHMIDGRVNPALCMRCHGRQNNERCRACHK